MTQVNQSFLEVKDITKNFPGVKALKGVNFKLKKGEVHSIIGENGAGKSTLMKIILGSHLPTSGELYLNDKPYKPKGPADALNQGISMIHQEISLIPTISVSENIWLGKEAQFGTKLFVNKKAQELATKEILAHLGLDIRPDVEVSKLSISEMQLVEIARSVSSDSDIIIMDEPTSALTNTEIDKLFKIIFNLKKQGKSVIFISHKLDEVLHVSDSITVLRDGKFISSFKNSNITKSQLVKLMVGRDMSNLYPKEKVELGEVCFEVKNLTQNNVFTDVSFSVRQGEILGFAGLMGAGRTEIMQAIFGITKISSGEMFLHGKKIHNKYTKDAVENKLSMVTEDRLRRGAIHKLSVKINASLAYLKTVTKFGFVKTKQELSDVQDMVDKMAIKLTTIDNEIGQLSGGNQQKVIIAKWLLTQPDILILDEPTRGIDVGAKAEIYKLIGKMAVEKKAILFVSSELPELMGIADRILVVKDGRIVHEFKRNEFDQEQIMSHAFGLES